MTKQAAYQDFLTKRQAFFVELGAMRPNPSRLNRLRRERDAAFEAFLAAGGKVASA